MPGDCAEVPQVRARGHDLDDLGDHVLELRVGRVVVRPDPDPGLRSEVAEDLPLGKLLVHGREVVDVDRDGGRPR